MAGLQSALVTPQLDPPLPPGSADDLERRMKARRESQVAGGGAIISTPASAMPATSAPAGGAPTTPAPATTSPAGK